MKRVAYISALILGGAIVFGSVQPLRADEFREVEPEELLANPKHYWSLGILFKDRLTAWPGGTTIRLGKKRYIYFTTERLGACYVDAEVEREIQDLPLGREYLFKGTVLNRGQSIFTRKDSFYVVVTKVTPAVSDADAAKTLLGPKVDEPEIATDGTSSRVTEILASAQSGLFSFAEESGVEVGDILQRDSLYSRKAMDIIYTAVLTAERKNKTTATEILSEFIRATLAKQYASPPQEELPPALEEKEFPPPSFEEPVGYMTTPEPIEEEIEIEEPEPPRKSPRISLKVGVTKTTANDGDKEEPDTEEPEPSREPAPKPNIPLSVDLPVGR